MKNAVAIPRTIKPKNKLQAAITLTTAYTKDAVTTMRSDNVKNVLMPDTVLPILDLHKLY